MTTQGPQGNAGLDSLLQSQRLGAGGGGGKFAPAPGIFAGIIPDIDGMSGGLNFKAAALRIDNMCIAAVPFGNPAGLGNKTNNFLLKIAEQCAEINNAGHALLAQGTQSSSSFMSGSAPVSGGAPMADATQGGGMGLG